MKIKEFRICFFHVLVSVIIFALISGCSRKEGKVIGEIGDRAITEEEFEAAISTLPPQQQKEMDDQEKRKKFFLELSEKILLAQAAAKEGYKDKEELSKRLDLVIQRTKTQSFYDDYLRKNNALPLKVLKQYYNKHKSEFRNDSGEVLSFQAVHSQVADSALLQKANIDSFYQANKENYQHKAFCEISYLKTDSKQNAQQAYSSLTSGKSLNDLDTTQNKILNAKIGKGGYHWELGSLVDLDSLLFSENKKLKESEFTEPIEKNGEFFIIQPVTCKDEGTTPLEEIHPKVSGDFLSSYKKQITSNVLEDLKKKYGAEMVDWRQSIDQQKIKDFYKANKENYMEPPEYDILHIQVDDKQKAEELAGKITSKEKFMELAQAHSTNEWTREQKGKAGTVKKGHVLPYGIGLIPNAYTQFDESSAGKIIGPINNNSTGKWHLFWLLEKHSQEPLPFERVSRKVRNDYLAKQKADVDPDQVLARLGDGSVIKEKEVLFLREEIPDYLQSRYNRKDLVDFLLHWKLASQELQETDLINDNILQARIWMAKDRYWSDIYRDSVLNRSYGLEAKQLAETFNANKSLFTSNKNETDYTKYAADVAAFLALDSADFEQEYEFYPDRYRKNDSLRPYQEVIPDIFRNLRSKGMKKAQEKQIMALRQDLGYSIQDSTLAEAKINEPVSAYEKAEKLHLNRQLDQSEQLYKQIRDQFPNRQSLQDSVSFGLAQIYLEREQYQEAMAEYRKISYLNPESPNEYKARFMVGFIYAEHLKKDSLAVRTFRAMLEKYPDTDLSDDADWMIRNIESGGALMPTFEEDTTATPNQG